MLLTFFLWQFASVCYFLSNSNVSDDSTIVLVDELEDDEESEETEVREGSVNQVIEEITEESKLFSEITIRISKRQKILGSKNRILFSQLHKQDFFSPPELIG